MSYEYLVASLPHLALGEPPPFSSEEFRFHCQGPLRDEDLEELILVLDGRASEGRSAFSRRWFSIDAQIRNAVARARATERGVDARGYLRDHPDFDSFVAKAVSDAYGRHNPLERERALDECRWHSLGQLALEETFGLSAVLAFAVKLQIAERWSAISKGPGRERFDHLVAANLERQGIDTGVEVGGRATGLRR